ncbi:hypothetical protein [Streptomyces europaeiscabiei]|uniref:Uncharacterized protein n=1 Tax=Streptomyces europaeiscabiei TaxID=146819 RepID=A0ABU4N7A9_9ACTN|nr:hypothetical protein [Streptomyces europaeiscabiei]MDX3541840.1 hypothetical protein [Streptomyces europaeiscabiei]MDX3550834.1 hypothetical protein [Streptomyces europaeiscabiei]MDX3665059.1 hypothetical protein [Streptomyces europaeiscabiei]MDX3698606.1 hypothetical protein [Streptomyces europaeiscabiei]MDX3707723.1 hypothetical protein [Streptomyces europaeiscabiei]
MPDGFTAIHAKPGSRVTAEIHVLPRRFPIRDTERYARHTQPGRHQDRVGRRSRDPRPTVDVTAGPQVCDP